MTDLKTFVLWNSEKCSMHFKNPCDDLETLLVYEEEHGNLSSTVNLTEDQLNDVITAVFNETDIMLNFAELK